MMERTCSIEGCEKPHIARGWCHKHYKRWQAHGDPLTVLVGPDSPRTALVRFWEKVDKRGPIPVHAVHLGRCWIWTAFRTRDFGYGLFIDGAKHYPAHRYAYLYEIGPIPEGLELDHLCSNPRCVRPSHLEPVTHQENMRRSMNQSAQQARQTHCLRGHPFNEENTFYQRRGSSWHRRCRACDALRHRAKRAKRRQAS